MVLASQALHLIFCPLRPVLTWLNFFLVPFHFNCRHTFPSLCDFTILDGLIILQLSPCLSTSSYETNTYNSRTCTILQWHAVHCQPFCNWRFPQILATSRKILVKNWNPSPPFSLPYSYVGRSDFFHLLLFFFSLFSFDYFFDAPQPFTISCNVWGVYLSYYCIVFVTYSLP